MPNPPAPFFSAAHMGDSVESLQAMHGRGQPWIYWICLLGIAAALAALPLVPVEITIRAAGIIRPTTERIELKAAVGGRIARVLVRDNGRVGAGEPLVELVSLDVRERIARNQTLQRETSDLVADLQQLTSTRFLPEDPVTSGPAVPESLPDMCTLVLAHGRAQFLAQFNAAQLAVRKARSVCERALALSTKGLISHQELEDARYAEARASMDSRQLVEQAQSAWQTQLRDEQTALAQLISEEKRLREELALAVLRAPAAGTIQGLIGLSPGANIVAGQSLGSVSPDDGLVVDTRVASKDIGLVRGGQRAHLQIDAYPYTQWGLIDGEVTRVAADASSDGAQATFRVVLRPLALTLRLANGTEGTIRKGMTLTARFVIARRSLLQVLYEDASQWLDPQGRPVTS